MRILVSHVNYPSQFRRLVASWASEGHDIIFLSRKFEWHADDPQSFRLILYSLTRSTSPYTHPYLRRFDNAVLEGQAVFRECVKLKNNGWIPDCVISHVGFGNGFYLKDVFPNSLRIGLAEWFYNPNNSDVDFLPPHSITDDHKLCLRTWNAECLLELSSLDEIVVPTKWQCSQFPPLFRDRIHVIHEGVDTDVLPNPHSPTQELLARLPTNSDIKILTFVSRCFEEYRGFPQAMDTFNRLQLIFPNLHILIVGQDCTAYGQPRSDGQAWSSWAKNTFNFDSKRIHWLGSLQLNDYHYILSISDVHFYLTIPFVLSWSLLEAMASGCSIVASNTPPVQEVIEHDVSGLLVDFFDNSAQVDAITRILNDDQLSSALSTRARKSSLSYSHNTGLAAWTRLIQSNP